MNAPPEPRPTTEAGRPGDDLLDATVAAAVEHSIDQARKHGTTPQVVIGSTPPESQPGRPPMSQKGMDDSVRMICFGGAAFLTCGGVSIVMIASDYADPTAIGVFFGGIAGIVLALKALVKRLRRLVPSEHHHHYNAPVEQDNRQDHSTTTNKWWGRSSTEKEEK